MLFDLFVKVLKYKYLLDMNEAEAITYTVNCTCFSDVTKQFYADQLQLLALTSN